jgi:hypothetical protein
MKARFFGGKKHTITIALIRKTVFLHPNQVENFAKKFYLEIVKRKRR